MGPTQGSHGTASRQLIDAAKGAQSSGEQPREQRPFFLAKKISNDAILSCVVLRGSARKESLEILDTQKGQKLQLEEAKRLWRLP